MKYIKKYEMIDGFSRYKKYIVVESHQYNYVIVQIEETTITRLYTYENNELNKDPYTAERIAVDFDDAEPHIIFTSDDLQECLDIIPKLSQQRKYNL